MELIGSLPHYGDTLAQLEFTIHDGRNLLEPIDVPVLVG